MRFMVDMVGSPSFGKMARKYLSTPDVTSFLREMAAKPDVKDSTQIFLRDYNLGAAVKNLNSPVINGFAALMGGSAPAETSASLGAKPAGDPSGNIAPGVAEKLRANPELKKYLDSQEGAPAVVLPGGRR